MATEVFIPKVDMVMETATFVEWLIDEGEHVEKGQPLFVILTDKAAMEIEAPAVPLLALKLYPMKCCLCLKPLRSSSNQGRSFLRLFKSRQLLRQLVLRKLQPQLNLSYLCQLKMLSTP